MIRQIDLSPEREKKVLAALNVLNPTEQYLDAALGAIVNVLGCSLEDAFRVLGSLQDRNLIVALPERHIQKPLAPDDELPVRRWRWVSLLPDQPQQHQVTSQDVPRFYIIEPYLSSAGHMVRVRRLGDSRVLWTCTIPFEDEMAFQTVHGSAVQMMIEHAKSDLDNDIIK